MLPKFDKPVPSILVDAQITPQEFDFIRTVVEKNAGIVLGSNKVQLVQGRLVRRARELGLSSIGEYCDIIRNGGPEELVGLINAITTNVTSFFRESHHFDALMSVMLPEAMGRNERTRRLRIWSAGCSSGEEPYSIAMASAEVLVNSRGWNFRILATDIDSEILHTAEQGYYSGDRLAGISEERRRRWFARTDDNYQDDWQVVPELKSLIAFQSLNLMHNWPMRGPFDIIFCRNVMIYFDQPTRDRLLMRYAGLLADGGYLCLGHSESIHSQHSHFKLVGRTIYRKAGGLIA